LQLLQEKCGSKSTIYEFRRACREIIASGTLPEYIMELDQEADMIDFKLKKAIPGQIAAIAKKMRGE